MIPLTPAQRKTLLAIEELIKEKKYPPTYKEIGGKLNIAKSCVSYLVHELEHKQYISLEFGLARTIVILVDKDTLMDVRFNVRRQTI